MTIAVTGAGGLIGRVLTTCVERSGRTAVAFPNREQLDLAGPAAPLQAWLAIHQPDAIVHLAGWRHGNNFATAFLDNVAATYNLLAAVAATPKPIRIVVASSAAVYGNARGHPSISVESERRPVNVYGVTKALQEDTCALARASAGIDISIARIFNIFDLPGDTWSVIPNLIARIGASENGDVVHVASARCIRDFVHIEDVCNALLLAATLPTVPRVFNVATGIGTQIGDIARRIAGLLHRTVDLHFDNGVDPAMIIDSIGDPKEACAMGWTYRAISDRDIATYKTFSNSP